MQIADLGRRAAYVAATGVIGAATRVAIARGEVGANLFSRDQGIDDVSTLDAIRAEGALVPGLGGLVSVDHQVVNAVLRNPHMAGITSTAEREELLSARALGVLMRAALFDPVAAMAAVTHVPNPIGPASLIGSQPPDHTRLRRVVSRAFLPAAIATWRHRIEDIAADLADQALAVARRDGGVDLVDAFAAPFPIQVICELLGVPIEDRDRFRPWGSDIAAAIDPMTPATQRRAARALEELERYFLDLFDRRRREPGDAVIDVLLAAHDDEPGLSDDEVMATAMLMLLAGFETTVNLLGNGVHQLVRNPDQQALVGDDRDLVPNLVEEVLRYDPPVALDARVSGADVDVLGTPVPVGTVVTLSIAGANRDPAVFDDPHRFDVTRAGADRHLAFAAGIHYCLGASLARVEGDVAFRALLDRFGGFAIAGPAVRRPTFTLSGFDRLVVAPATASRGVTV